MNTNINKRINKKTYSATIYSRKCLRYEITRFTLFIMHLNKCWEQLATSCYKIKRKTWCSIFQQAQIKKNVALSLPKLNNFRETLVHGHWERIWNQCHCSAVNVHYPQRIIIPLVWGNDWRGVIIDWSNFGDAGKISIENYPSAYWGRDKMAAISQMTFWLALWLINENVWISINFHWSLFPKVQLIICQHWFR